MEGPYLAELIDDPGRVEEGRRGVNRVEVLAGRSGAGLGLGICQRRESNRCPIPEVKLGLYYTRVFRNRQRGCSNPPPSKVRFLFLFSFTSRYLRAWSRGLLRGMRSPAVACVL